MAEYYFEDDDEKQKKYIAYLLNTPPKIKSVPWSKEKPKEGQEKFEGPKKADQNPRLLEEELPENFKVFLEQLIKSLQVFEERSTKEQLKELQIQPDNEFKKQEERIIAIEGKVQNQQEKEEE